MLTLMSSAMIPKWILAAWSSVTCPRQQMALTICPSTTLYVFFQLLRTFLTLHFNSLGKWNLRHSAALSSCETFPSSVVPLVTSHKM